MGFAVVMVHEVVGAGGFNHRAAPEQARRLLDACAQTAGTCVALDLSGMTDLSRTYFGALLWPVLGDLVEQGRFAIAVNAPDGIVDQLADGVSANGGALWIARFRNGALRSAELLGGPAELSGVINEAVRRGSFLARDLVDFAPGLSDRTLASRLVDLASRGVLQRDPSARPARYAVPWSGYALYVHGEGGPSDHSGGIPSRG